MTREQGAYDGCYVNYKLNLRVILELLISSYTEVPSSNFQVHQRRQAVMKREVCRFVRRTSSHHHSLKTKLKIKTFFILRVSLGILI